MQAHWNQYTAGLARDAKARKALETRADETAVVETLAVAPPTDDERRAAADVIMDALASTRKRKRGKTVAPVPGAQGDAG